MWLQPQLQLTLPLLQLPVFAAKSLYQATLLEGSSAVRENSQSSLRRQAADKVKIEITCVSFVNYK